jgi:hypothetical protein
VIGRGDTEHFKAREFACPHCGRVLVEHALQEALERLRAAIKHPIRIVSGYRCPVHNREVGGARHSLHMLGMAADIEAGLARPADARAAGFRGIGVRDGWAIHLDVRAGPVVVFLDSPGSWPSHPSQERLSAGGSSG